MHLFFLLYMYKSALELMPPKENQTFEQEFKPNLVNTICFLVNFMIQVGFSHAQVNHLYSTIEVLSLKSECIILPIPLFIEVVWATKI